jgi:hypothetical protein
MNKKSRVQLKVNEGSDDVAYVELRDHPHQPTFGLVQRSVDIHQLIEGYLGPRISIEFDKMNRPIGIEIIYASEEDSEDT